MAERHQIESFEFETWVAEVEGEDPSILSRLTRENLYDFWVEGYSAWEVPALIL